MWLSYRCFSARSEESVPIFGTLGLAAQLGNVQYARPRKFREKLESWLEVIRAMWPEYPAHRHSGTYLLIRPAAALVEKGA